LGIQASLLISICIFLGFFLEICDAAVRTNILQPVCLSIVLPFTTKKHRVKFKIRQCNLHFMRTKTNKNNSPEDFSINQSKKWMLNSFLKTANSFFHRWWPLCYISKRYIYLLQQDQVPSSIIALVSINNFYLLQVIYLKHLISSNNSNHQRSLINCIP